jgi:5-methylcytosine-specific restriction endonuclease McrA
MKMIMIKHLFDMANAPKKIQRPWVPERKPFERDNWNQEFYNSTPWRKFARVYKDRNPLCVVCERQGLIEPAKVADHIIPINKGGEKFNEKNIQSLCESCHNRKSATERGMG